jgi:TRAP-type uncharacterized transport system substrate-binding protein
MNRAINNEYRLLVVTLLLAALAGCGEQQHEYRLLEPPLPLDQEIAADLVEVFEQNSEHRITLVPMPGAAETALDALEDGYADLAFASNAQPYRQGITTVMPLYPTVLHVMYRHGRDASDPRALLLGASVFAGPVGSSSRQLMTTILTGLDMREDDVHFATDAGELPDIVVLYMPISPESVSERLAGIGATGAYQLLGFGLPEEVGTGSPIDRTTLLNPRLSPFVIPVGTYGEMQPEPVVTLAVDKLLVAGTDQSAAAIYDLIHEIRRLQPALAADRPMLFQHLADEFDESDSTFVLHPGAQAFTHRDAPDIYERYSGVAEVVVTLVIGLISGFYAVVQIYHRRRKNRIDRFYTDVIAMRDSISSTSTAAARAVVVGEVRELQNEAFEMLVNEKLAADESFRIFITLSNDIITDIGATAPSVVHPDKD